MRYVIIAGSHRTKSQSSKIAEYIQHVLQKMPNVISIDIIDLKNNPLPLWHDAMWNKEPEDMYQERISVWEPMKKLLEQADAYVVITPEWSGMASPGIKNFMLYCKAEVTGNKPAMLVGVSSGVGGSYPVAELRMSSYKNTQLVYIPQHVIVRSVNDMCNDFDNAEPDSRDERIRKRIKYSLAMLEQYAKGLKIVRESGVVNLEDYAHGM